MPCTISGPEKRVKLLGRERIDEQEAASRGGRNEAEKLAGDGHGWESRSPGGVTGGSGTSAYLTYIGGPARRSQILRHRRASHASPPASLCHLAESGEYGHRGRRSQKMLGRRLASGEKLGAFRCLTEPSGGHRNAGNLAEDDGRGQGRFISRSSTGKARYFHPTKKAGRAMRRQPMSFLQ